MYVSTCHACSFQDLWKWKSARPTTTILDKSLGTLCISGTFSNSHRSNPSPHPANNVGRVYPEIEPVEKLATPPEVKMATFSCATFAGNRELAEWAHIACWSSQSELSVPFILPSRGFSYVKISVDWNILCDRTSEFFIRSNTKFRLLLEILHAETVYHQHLEVPISINTILIHFTDIFLAM